MSAYPWNPVGRGVYPPHTEVVLIAFSKSGEVAMGSYHGASWFYYDTEGDYAHGVTHWAPLPEAPKEGEE